MADNMELEMIAEDFISHYLQRNGILVAKPKFDKEGGDLLAMLGVKDGALFCRVQSKGRSLLSEKSETNIKVARSYVTESLVVMAYIDDGMLEKTHLYCFFANDLAAEPWKQKDDHFVLYLKRADFEERLKKFKVDSKGEVAEQIKGVIRKANAAKEIIFIYDQQRVPLPKEIDVERKLVEFEQRGPSVFPLVLNPLTNVKYTGTPCPGLDPTKFEYDVFTDTWKAKG